MDELIRHCLHELSFDGDLGCDVSRLNDFVHGFYTCSGSPPCQNVDDAYCAYVWSVIVQQPGVRVGTTPPGGAATEVWIAPQTSAKRKAQAKGEEVEEPSQPTTLDIIPDATIKPLEDLRTEYGNSLRIAVEPEITFAAITGSHIRPSKLTPMVYTALQFITRGRADGISVVDLGKKSGYDQKTCFYLVKQLLDLGLIVKLKRLGTSTNLCVHKYFHEHTPVWQNIVEEEAGAKADESDEESEDDATTTGPSSTNLQFTPIDGRHLASMPLVRGRIIKLLKNSPGHMHTSQNLLIKIGFVSPQKSHRRFFRGVMRQLKEEGVVEKVLVPHADRARFPNRKVTCIRLLPQQEPSEKEKRTTITADGEITEELAELKMNLTLHKQMITLLDNAGTNGMTLSQLSDALCDFDRRTIELLLSRLEKDPPPSHLSDLSIAQLGQTHGREKRYVWYTVKHYRAIATREKFDDPRYQDDVYSSVGAFLPVEEQLFYKDEDSLNQYIDNFKAKYGAGGASKQATKKGRGGKAKATSEGGDAEESATVKKGTKRKKAEAPGDGTEEPPPKQKRGRPRKKSVEEPEGSRVQDAEQPEKPPPKKRGRPPKKRPPPGSDVAESVDEAKNGGEKEEAPQEPPAPKKRGRPPKKKSKTDGTEPSASGAVAAPRRRGRPPKVKPAQPDAIVAAAEDVQTETVAGTSTAIPSYPAHEPSDSRTANLLSAADGDIFALQAATDVSAEAVVMPPARAGEDTSPSVLAPLGSASLVAVEHTLLRRSYRKRKPRRLSNGYSPAREVPSSNEQGPGQSLSQEYPQHSRPRGSDGAGEETSASNEVAPDSIRDSDIVHLEEQPTTINSMPHAVTSTVHPSLTTTSQTDDITVDPRLTDESGPRDVNFDTLAAKNEEYFAVIGDDALKLEQDAATKRRQPDTSVMEPPKKRFRTEAPRTSSASGFRSKANISQSRRESEILRIVSDFGGIVNTSIKDFYEAHAALVDTITKAGEVASTRPGARLDKRTVEATLKDLESRQKLKILTTSVKTPTGSYRPVRIVYLPDTSDEAMRAFLTNIHIPQIAPEVIKTLDEPVAYGGSKIGKKPARRVGQYLSLPSLHNDAAPLQDSQMKQLFEESDETIRTALLTEKSTLAQAHGFIAGRAARARELHLFTIKLFEIWQASPNIVSSEQRIIRMPYYFEELPIATYCKLISCLTSSEDLVDILNSDADRSTPVGQVSAEICQSLGVARSRSKARLLDLFEILRCLQLVQPLQPSASAQPLVICPAHDEHPSGFDAVAGDVWTPLTAPLYWQFASEASLYVWALSEESPPYWKKLPVSTVTQCAEYWRELQDASIDSKYAKSLSLLSFDDTLSPTSATIALARCLRRHSSWTSGYSLSYNQSEYLQQFLDKSDGNTPLQNEDGGEARLHRIAWVVSAPVDVVRQFFEKIRRKHVHELEKAQKRHREAMEAKAQDAAAKAALAMKAAEAKRQKEKDWDDMVNRTHPDPLRGSAATRVRRIRTQFMQSSGTDHAKWEAEIAQAVREALMATKKILRSSKPPILSVVPRTSHVAPPVVVTNGPEKAIEDLVAQQGSLPVRPAQKKKRGKDAAKVEPNADELIRRTRFQWNKDFDELARDAIAVVKARCRDIGRLDLGAIEQVFPGVPRNSVRQRIAHLRDSPGAEAYQTRLEDKWYELWVQHRGTDILPDKDPGSAINFDLVAHIKFLRKHVDKNALRVGFVEEDIGFQVALPATVEHLESMYEVADKKAPVPAWDFMWNVVAEENREKHLAQQAVLTEMNDVPPSVNYADEHIHVADSALKMVLGTPSASYDAHAASELLHLVGEEHVQAATMNLLTRGILSKVIRDPQKTRPGRTLQISDSNQNALGGSLPQEVFQDAAALEDLLTQEEDAGCWREWSLLAGDGDNAALLELVSEGKVDFQIDTTQARAARPKIDWNSKKADDDDIETAIQIRLNDTMNVPPRSYFECSVEPSAIQTDIQVEQGTSVEHGKTVNGAQASCRLSSNGLVDCQACLDQASAILARDLSAEDAKTMKQISRLLRDAKATGLTKEQLLTNIKSLSSVSLVAISRRMTDASVPLACWTGYKSEILLSSAYLDSWTVSVSNPHGPRTKLLPRRWLDVAGRKINDLWDAALRAVIGVILLRPGITQTEVRWRLRSVYDRQEINEALKYLLDDGFVTKRILTTPRYPEVGPPDDREEEATAWFVVCGGEKHWFQL